MIEGSCLCGKVHFTIDGTLGQMGNCHCSKCRKAHGAAFATYADARTAEFSWTRGEALVKQFQSSTNGFRHFCSECGSPLLWTSDLDPDGVAVVIAALDTHPGRKPEGHIFVGSKADWHDITDPLPQFDALP